ncbi:MAG TPA: 50S ribosomal protein L18 [Chloroflexia bacterium]|jgi:large subunit ribosomal protein L18|nr:50S ribosomal protein L18 [Chloroflexia bacterium]
MKIIPHKLSSRAKRHRRVRATVVGTSARPRLNVFRSLKHIYAQVIDDSTGHTLAAAGTLDKDLRGQDGTKTVDAQAVGRLVAQRAIDAGIKQVVFDRGGYQYHGRVKALAEAAREAGLDF